jgi:lysozyme family protein
MTSNSKNIINFVIENEAYKDKNGNLVGYTVDHAGETAFGITKKYLESLGKFNVDMKKYTLEDAINEYGELLKKSKCDQIKNEYLATRVFDMCVNSGTVTSVRMLQITYNSLWCDQIVADGIMGINTLRAINSLDDVCTQILTSAFKQKRLDYYNMLIEKNPSKYAKFANGWRKRAVK